MKNRRRNQRVTLRFRRREDLKKRVHTILVRSVALALIVGFGAGLVTGGDSFLSRFMMTHTPDIRLSMSKALAGLPALAELPQNRFWLWLPGTGRWVQKRLCKKYMSVKSVRFERDIAANRIIMHVEPRVPLVTWNGLGFDEMGALFAITPGTWSVMPQASFLASARKPELGKWLGRLAAVPQVWSQVLSLKQGPYETIELTLKSGTVIIWGTPETEPFVHKAQTLMRVLDDAHKNMGGAAFADLRFFEQGRIIVRPKGK